MNSGTLRAVLHFSEISGTCFHSGPSCCGSVYMDAFQPLGLALIVGCRGPYIAPLVSRSCGCNLILESSIQVVGWNLEGISSIVRTLKTSMFWCGMELQVHRCTQVSSTMPFCSVDGRRADSCPSDSSECNEVQLILDFVPALNTIVLRQFQTLQGWLSEPRQLGVPKEPAERPKTLAWNALDNTVCDTQVDLTQGYCAQR